jgi:osmotically-inducible protein OsmY
MAPSATLAACEIALDSRVHDALQQSPYLSNRKLRFETQQGRVVLRGIVASYYQKQMAQEALRRLEGVHQIENHLEVAWT